MTASGKPKRNRINSRGRIRYGQSTTLATLITDSSRAISDNNNANDNLPSTRCDANEIFLECGPNCSETCEQRGVRRKRCKVKCRRGCFCLPGYIRHQRTCIKKTDCPGMPSSFH